MYLPNHIAIRVMAMLWLIAIPYGFTQAANNDIQLDAVPVNSTIIHEPVQLQMPLNHAQNTARDGSDYLKSIAGFNLIRRGGVNGEAVLRGMAGSRLNILVDGNPIAGSCEGRMDTPTSYIFPENYDTLNVVKGPQTVLQGAGASAGTVSFERKVRFFDKPDTKGRGSILLGSFGRHDEAGSIQVGGPSWAVQGTATNSQSGDYRDGDGKAVHSKYHRYSGNLTADFALDNNTQLQFSGAYSDGWAAFADRTMDGVQFQRQNVSARLLKNNLSTWLDKLSVQVNYAENDHIMDNFSLRPSDPMHMSMWHRHTGRLLSGKIKLDIIPNQRTLLNVGLDARHNTSQHGAGDQSMNPNASPTEQDALFQQIGAFAEGHYLLNSTQHLVGGYRTDFWRAKDMRHIDESSTSGAQRQDTLHSGFARFEQDFGNSTAYVGLGHAQRFPDYWELIIAHASGTDASQSAFGDTKSEKTTQLDTGWRGRWGGLSLNGALFYNQIDDFILLDYRSGFVAVGDHGASTGSARNIQAQTYGGEWQMAYQIDADWLVNASVAYVRGRNKTDHMALAQLPPLDTRLGLTYQQATWFVKGELRGVHSQNHYALGQGTVAGKDLGYNAGFATLSVQGGWRAYDKLLITAGIDNLLDKNYAEFISRNGVGFATYSQTTRVNESGRAVWLKGTLEF